MSTITLIILVAIVAIIAIAFGSKASAPSLMESILFILGFGSVILIGTERWINWINMMVNNARSIFGIVNEKWDITDTIGMFKSGEMNKTTAGTITVSAILLIASFRLVTTVFALLAGMALGMVAKVWMEVYDIGISGII